MTSVALGCPTYSSSVTDRPSSWSRTTPANETTAPAALSATASSCSATDSGASTTRAIMTPKLPWLPGGGGNVEVGGIGQAGAVDLGDVVLREVATGSLVTGQGL